MRLVATLLMLTFLGACGDASNAPMATSPSVAVTQPLPTVLAPTTPQSVPPDAATGTTAPVIPVRDDALIASMTPMHVTEPCPPSPGTPDGTSAMDTELAKLEPMLGVVLGYGVQHKDEFGTYGLIWHGTNDASVFISFTQHLDLHRDALEQLVAHRDELIVCQVPVSEDVGRALVAKLTDDLEGRFSMVGYGSDGVEIVLNPGEEILADELVAEYGDAVVVTVCSNPAGCAYTAAIATASTTDTPATSTSTDDPADGPLIVSDDELDRMEALNTGSIGLVGGCVGFQEATSLSPIVWPPGVRWDADRESVLLPDGTVIEMGQRVTMAGGGGLFDMTIEAWPALADAFSKCDFVPEYVWVANLSDLSLDPDSTTPIGDG